MGSQSLGVGAHVQAGVAVNPLNREPIQVPAWNRGYLAYPWRAEPRWSECGAIHNAIQTYRPIPPQPIVFDPTAVMSPIAPSAETVILFRMPALWWGRTVVVVYLADEDREARAQLCLFMLASALITRIATVVHGEGWLDR